MANEGAVYDLQAVYDAQILPLMEQIIAVCKEHKIPVLASFAYAMSEDKQTLCTTAILPGGGQPRHSRTLGAAITIIERGIGPDEFLCVVPRDNDLRPTPNL